MLIDVITGFLKQIKFECYWPSLLGGLLIIPVLLSLGFWQLDRAEEKRHIVQQEQQQKSLPAITINDLTSLSADALSKHRRVLLEGHFASERYWLLDNKIRSGKVGYEVVVPFVLSADRGLAVLVNIGWLEAPALRTQWPVVRLPAHVISLSGNLYRPSKNAIYREQAGVAGADDWPQRVLHIDHALAQQQLAMPIFDYQILIDPFDPQALITDWKSTNQSPEKHQGYAVQWFAMAIALLVMVFISCSNVLSVIKNKEYNHNKERSEA